MDTTLHENKVGKLLALTFLKSQRYLNGQTKLEEIFQVLQGLKVINVDEKIENPPRISLSYYFSNITT